MLSTGAKDAEERLIARVALDVPVDQLFDYWAGEATSADIGSRVIAPFGRRLEVGLLLELRHGSNLDSQRIKPVNTVLRDGTALPPDCLQLLSFVSAYYHHPLGQVMMGALPQPLRRTRAIPEQESCYAATSAGREKDPASLGPRHGVARRLLGALQHASHLTRHEIAAMSPRAGAALKRLIEAGWVKKAPLPPHRQGPSTSASPVLTREQAAAVREVTEAFTRFRVFLLHGVTGSGKTEVYLRLAEQTLQRGGQMLVLVPEINLTPQLVGAFRNRFPNARIACLHSAMGEGERFTEWRRAKDGEAAILIGTRLAVFAPLPKLVLIVVDEEHDSSFKQQEGLRYSARDVAVMRAKQVACPIVLGSATPSLESYVNATNGRYRLLNLVHRPIARAPPAISFIDLRQETCTEGLSKSLLDRLNRGLQRGEQSLIFINRRGYAPVMLCPACGFSACCERCTSRLVMHLLSRELRCHLCGHAERIPRACPVCGNQDLHPVGQGTQRIERALAKAFPQARLLRIDRDSTRRRDAWPRMLQMIGGRAADILVGTQIVTKGHDFPQLSLVGVLNADASLYSVDFRASERLFAQLMQVAGRAGRAALPGEVLIQTRSPRHPLFEALARQDYAGFAAELAAERRRAEFPPFVHQALLRAEAVKLELALDFLREAAQRARSAPDSITIFDPVPAPITRLRGKERAHLLVQSASRRALRSFLERWYGELKPRQPAGVRAALDVDPLEF